MPELSEEDLKKMMVNPFYAVTINEALFGEHEPMVTKHEWAKIFARNILENDDGSKLPPELIEASIIEHALRLLDVLEGNYV